MSSVSVGRLINSAADESTPGVGNSLANFKLEVVTCLNPPIPSPAKLQFQIQIGWVKTIKTHQTHFAFGLAANTY